MDTIIAYHAAIDALVALVGAPRSLMHVHAGMAIYLGCLLALGTRRGSLAAVFLAVALAMFHETMNRLFHGSWRWHDTTQDLVLSLFWPTMCYGVSCYRRWHWTESMRQRANDRMLHLYDYRPEPASRAPGQGRAPELLGDRSR